MPEDVIAHYKLTDIATHDGYIYCKIQKGMHGLPQAGIIAHQLLKKCLKVHGYHQSTITPGLWKHDTRPISFSLVFDDFKVKYVGEENAQHLLDTVRKYYKCLCNWEGEQYCGLTIKWDYKGQKVHILMPGYVRKALTRFQHPPQQSNRISHIPTLSQIMGHIHNTHRGKTSLPPLIRRGKSLSKKFAKCFSSLHGRSMGGCSRLSAHSLPNRQTQQKKQ